MAKSNKAESAELTEEAAQTAPATQANRGAADVERNTERVKAFSKSIAKVREELAKDVVGQKDIIDNVLIAKRVWCVRWVKRSACPSRVYSSRPTLCPRTLPVPT